MSHTSILALLILALLQMTKVEGFSNTHPSFKFRSSRMTMNTAGKENLQQREAASVLTINLNEVVSPRDRYVQQLQRSAIMPTAAALASILAVAAITGGSRAAYAAEDTAAASPAVVEKKDIGPPPSDFGLIQNDYYADAQKIVSHMRYAVQMEKGMPFLSEIAQKTKDEMSEFVSFYRRFQGISGKQSFSLLYTSINVLAGHYTSYGVKIPVPEKRKKRLLQEFNDIEKNIRKKR